MAVHSQPPERFSMSNKQNELFSETALEALDDRKRWHNLEALLGIDAQLCASCREPLGSRTIADPAIGIEEVAVCINPECRKFGKELL